MYIEEHTKTHSQTKQKTPAPRPPPSIFTRAHITWRMWKKMKKKEDEKNQQRRQHHIDKRNPFLWLMAYIRFSIFSLIKLKRMGNNNETKRKEMKKKTITIIIINSEQMLAANKKRTRAEKSVRKKWAKRKIVFGYARSMAFRSENTKKEEENINNGLGQRVKPINGVRSLKLHFGVVPVPVIGDGAMPMAASNQPIILQFSFYDSSL